MTDKLDAILTELEALEQALFDVQYGAAATESIELYLAYRQHWPYLLAKLRAAVELEKGCGSGMWVIQNRHNKDLPEWEGYAAAAEDDIRAALTAWQRAGEEK